MRLKKFDQELYKKFDELAKKYALDVLTNSGLQVKRNSSKVGVDLIVYNDKEELFYVEVEVKRYIKPNENFSFETLHIPYRKLKYCNLKLPTLFMLFSECGQAYLCVWDKFVIKSNQKEVSNKYVDKGEIFFDVNIKECVDDSIDKAFKRKWKR